MKNAIAILAGGGPAPGINTVIASVTKIFLAHGFRVIGLHNGYKGIFSKEQEMIDLDFRIADEIYARGGSYLHMSRYRPSDTDFAEKFNIDFFTTNNIKLLVTIGGDDTASTANRVAKFLGDRNYPIANIHVPKTIDNDLPLPEGMPTFGYESAKDKGAVIARTIYADAYASNNWFLVSAMGRSAGHLAFGIGSAAHYPMIVIPEMFNRTEITMDKILRLIISAIIKRRLMGMEYGAVIVSEGVFHELDTKEMADAGVEFTYDAHGHPELWKISKAHVFAALIDNKLANTPLKVRPRPVELGYEMRCQTPIAYDLAYCSTLGAGVYKLFAEGKTGCMVCTDSTGHIGHLFLKDIQEPESGKILPRTVDIESDECKYILNYMLSYITPADYEAAHKYVPDPENYDMHNILNWERI